MKGLTYQLESYYIDGLDIPTIAEKSIIIDTYKDYLKKCKQKGEEVNYEHIAIKAMMFLNEKLRQQNYFTEVRNIVNLLLSGTSPVDVFQTLFPLQESEIEAYKAKFSDACEIIVMNEEVNWNRLGCSNYLYYQHIEDCLMSRENKIKVDFASVTEKVKSFIKSSNKKENIADNAEEE